MAISEADARRYARNGAAMTNFLPYLEDEISTLARALDRRMLSAIADGKMTPEMALEGWMERAAYSKMLKHFQQVVRFGADPTGGGLTSEK